EFRVDVVDYQRGFTWPTAGGAYGAFSIELVNQELDNDLGGSWRISNPSSGGQNALVPEAATWRYFKGTEEASSPRSAWRQVGFDDGSWLSGRAVLGYGEGIVTTTLSDMRDNYSSLFLRRSFTLEDADEIGALTLEVVFDDGFSAWINGTPVASSNLPNPDLPYDGTADAALENLDFQEFRLSNPGSYLRDGENVLAIQLFNASLGGSSDAFIDARLISGASGAGPTPAAINSVTAANVGPQLRQVEHLPNEPRSDGPVVISAKATDPQGVASVMLEYQVVNPGSYVRLSDNAFDSGWTELEMLDDGEGVDAIAGDDIYSVAIDASVQVHRRLVRYRIRATDELGTEVAVPYADDPQPNFAYFVYDGVPQWRGASRPGAAPVQTFTPEVLESVAVYHLIANATDVTNSQYVGGFDGRHFLGTLVYDGEIYDHVEFENRGEFSTYVSGKNKWRFHFQRGHEFRARNNYGERYRARWETMNLSAAATPWVPTNRGMAALGETVAFRSYQLAGVPSPNTNYLHFRIIDDAQEAHPSDQYRGDLWGLYMTIEHTDGAFLDERRLPDGNTYKIEGGNGDKRNQGPTQSLNSSDFNALKSGYNANSPISWWRANVDLHGYFSFRSVNRAVNNMDMREGWNITQYHNPETGLWSVMPWDLDMLYMPVTHWSGVMNFQNALRISTLSIEYRNRGRELRDLLFAGDQFSKLVLELAEFVNRREDAVPFVEMDEAMWNYHPRTSNNHRGAFYRNPSTHGARGGSITRTLVTADHRGMAHWISDFVVNAYGADFLRRESADGAIPNRPVIDYVGAAGHPLDDLRFVADPFSDPNSDGSFSAMQWRAAEIRDADLSEGIKGRYEIQTSWESDVLDEFDPEILIPAHDMEVGSTYRVRLRMRDTSGRWSHWSLPQQFTVGAPSVPAPSIAGLRITEIMYHATSHPDAEFIEIQNVTGSPIDLTHVSLEGAIDFDFDDGDIAELGPGEYALVVRRLQVFESVYGNDLPVAGEYDGQLSNGGEEIRFEWGDNETILEFDYDDAWYPETDGLGYSLAIVDPFDEANTWGLSSSWAASAEVGGSPGREDSEPPPGGRQLPSDLNQDGRLDLSDSIRLLLALFGGGEATLPCEGGIDGEGNAALSDFDGNGEVNLTDALGLVQYLFQAGDAPSLGTRCVRWVDCPHACF
ncbi:MAG: CotH kinase family protein, partial [Planctomycetota bacterium]